LPTIGASGAIAGVMGAYFFVYPWARVTVMVPLIIFFPTFETPAFLFLGLWLWSQISSGMALADTGQLGGIAFWAHVGGFFAGALLLLFMKPAKARRRSAREDD
jgi:membrane associated rhomboid family serine protease